MRYYGGAALKLTIPTSEDNMNQDLYPFLFSPVLKDYIWGGRNLETRLNRQLPEGIIAESWEIAAHKDGTTSISNGPLAGTPLTQLLETFGLDLIGERSKWALERDKFPLLIKLLDANRNLSVQVHPRDEYALEHEGNELGKTEMWVVLHADQDAEVILGVKEGTTADSFKQGIIDGALEPYLHHIPVKTGDHINVPAGSLHAIMGGLLIAEIQQNSNTTYRVYDWNRLGHDGKPRPLHVDKALEVINFAQVEPTKSDATLVANQDGIRREQLNQTEYFTVERVTMGANTTFEGSCNGETFEIWGLLAGGASVSAAHAETVSMSPVQFCMLPAALGDFKIEVGEETTLLRAYV